ncbi:MAG: helix-turn-helix domain-containing protein [Pirellulaceae bacterium]
MATDNSELIEKTKKRIAERELMRQLTILRIKADLSQGDVAGKMNCSQSKISKMEKGRDEDLRLGDLDAYLNAMGFQMRLFITPKPHKFVDEIKCHALQIRKLMHRLCELAKQDGDIANGVSQFICHETPYNLLRMVVEAAKALPQESLDEAARAMVEGAHMVFADIGEDTDMDDDLNNACAIPECPHTRREKHSV